jgi:2'-5' RNA ligase
MKDRMRTFIAIDLPNEVKKELLGYIQGISDGSRDYKWVDAGNLHITMAFLGDIGFDDITGIISAMEKAVSGLSPFPANLGKVSTFPSVIWVGLSEGDEECCSIYSRLKDEMASVGFRLDDKRYHPHITIARSRIKMNPEMRRGFETNEPPPPMSFNVKGLVLYESRLRPQGPEYIPLQRVPLGG